MKAVQKHRMRVPQDTDSSDESSSDDEEETTTTTYKLDGEDLDESTFTTSTINSST